MFHNIYWYFVFFFFFKQKTAYEMRISDWSSDVCSSDLELPCFAAQLLVGEHVLDDAAGHQRTDDHRGAGQHHLQDEGVSKLARQALRHGDERAQTSGRWLFDVGDTVAGALHGVQQSVVVRLVEGIAQVLQVAARGVQSGRAFAPNLAP